MRAARDWGVPPTRFLHEWSPRDRALALGLSAFEDGYYMGFPVEDVYDEDSEGHYVIVEKVNQVDAAIERFQKKQKDPTPGARLVAYDLRLNPEYEKYAD